MARIIALLAGEILKAIVSAIVIYIILNILGFDIIKKDRAIKYTGKDTATEGMSHPNHRWCYEVENLKPDDFCIQSITYREYELRSYDPMTNFKLYGVKVGEESRSAVANGETRILGGKKVPVCSLVYTYKDANFCYNDETMDANLVARDSHGKIVIVSPKDYYDVRKGFVAEIKDVLN